VGIRGKSGHAVVWWRCNARRRCGV
jgi:hypothetical protein